MTPTPSHVATDELIETLERLEKEATPGPWEWEGRTVSDGHVFIPECSSLGGTCIQLTHDYEGYAHDCDLLAFLRNHLPALISALKESQRLLAWEQAHADAMSALRLQLRGAREALVEARAAIQDWGSYAGKYFQEKHDLAGDLAKIDAALQPQGEK